MVWLSATDGYATVGKTVWRTTSGGREWTLAFNAPVIGTHWTSQIVANSPESVWFLVSGGVSGMSQIGYVLWHGTQSRWTAIADESYWAPTGYPSVHPSAHPGVSSPIMQPGSLVAMGENSLYFTGWNSNSTSHWVVFTNQVGHWKSDIIPITSTTPAFFMPPSALSFSSSTTGFLAGQSEMGHGSMMETTNGGDTWHTLTPHINQPN